MFSDDRLFLKEHNIEIIFIVKKNKVLYSSKYVYDYFSHDEDGANFLKTRIMKITYKGLIDSIDVFVILDEFYSGLLSLPESVKNPKLHFIAKEIGKYFSKNDYIKSLKIKLGIFFTCHTSYKAVMKNDIYLISNLSSTDGYIISENYYKNSSDVENLFTEYIKLSNEQKVYSVNKGSSKKNIIDEEESNNQNKSFINFMVEYGIENFIAGCAAMVDIKFSTENMSKRLNQMVQFFREEADAASYSASPKIRELGLSIFSDKKDYEGAINEDAAYPINYVNGPQQELIKILENLMPLGIEIVANIRMAIVLHLFTLFNIYKKVLDNHNIESYVECMQVIEDEYPDEKKIIMQGLVSKLEMAGIDISKLY